MRILGLLIFLFTLAVAGCNALGRPAHGVTGRDISNENAMVTAGHGGTTPDVHAVGTALLYNGTVALGRRLLSNDLHIASLSYCDGPNHRVNDCLSRTLPVHGELRPRGPTFSPPLLL